MRKMVAVTLLILLVGLLGACARGQTGIAPPEIRYGEDICVECNMIISDPRFAAGYAHQVGPGRYESIPFDDIGEMLIHADKHSEHQVVTWYVHDYATREWLDAAQAHFVFTDELVTPMAQGAAAHANRADAQQMAEELNGEVLDWEGLRAKHQAGELVVHQGPKTAEHGAGARLAMAGEMAQHSAVDEIDQRGKAGKVILGEVEIDGYTLRLASHGPLHAGYNALTVHLNGPQGQPVEGAQLTLRPMMNMPERQAPWLTRGAARRGATRHLSWRSGLLHAGRP